jgi:hypothetical protein
MVTIMNLSEFEILNKMIPTLSDFAFTSFVGVGLPQLFLFRGVNV